MENFVQIQSNNVGSTMRLFRVFPHSSNTIAVIGESKFLAPKF